MSINKVVIKALFLSLAWCGFQSCTQQNTYGAYKKLVEEELGSGKKDSAIFFGLSLGMNGKSFYSRCWEMNKAGLFTDGVNNNSVLYKLNHNELKYSASLNFYPDFYNNSVSRMRATLQYDSWAPWNKKAFSDSLLPDVLHLFTKWYPGGNPFMKLTDQKRGTIYVKVDGHRRITVGRYDDMIVKIDYADLVVEKQLTK